MRRPGAGELNVPKPRKVRPQPVPSRARRPRLQPFPPAGMSHNVRQCRTSSIFCNRGQRCRRFTSRCRKPRWPHRVPVFRPPLIASSPSRHTDGQEGSESCPSVPVLPLPHSHPRSFPGPLPMIRSRPGAESCPMANQNIARNSLLKTYPPRLPTKNL